MTASSNTFITILEFILAFGVLVFIHEFGHFLMARLSHIEVEEFGFGYPPRMVKLFHWKGTDFTLNWIPFGGFCRMKGENGETVEPGSFPAAAPRKRLLTLLGGPVMNLLLGAILITILITKVGASDTTRIQVVYVAPDSPASTANLQVGDLIQAVNNTAVTDMDSLSSLIQLNLDKPTELTIFRGNEKMAVELTPRSNPPEGQGAMGITIGYPTVKVSVIQAIPAAFLSTLDQGAQLILLPVKLITGQVAPSSARMVSVKGLYDIYSQVQTEDAQAPNNAGNVNTLNFLAILSVALGWTNLLPIPALDGGRILFLLPELLFRKKMRPELENKINFIGFSLLMLLMVVLIINDFINPIKIP